MPKLREKNNGGFTPTITAVTESDIELIICDSALEPDIDTDTALEPIIDDSDVEEPNYTNFPTVFITADAAL